MAKAVTPNSGDLAILSSLERKLAASGFFLERVEKKTAIEDADKLQPSEESTLDLLLKDGFNSPEAEFQALFAEFGLTRYADKARLADEGTQFRISRIVIRKNGGYNKDDDWGMTIVTEHGEPQMLTFERNAGRDRFLTMMAFYIWRHGTTGFCYLDSLPNASGQSFYVIGYVNAESKGLKEVKQLAADEPVTYEA